MILHLKDENFQDQIKKGLVLVDFYADWCGPCKMLSPILEEVDNEVKDISIVKVNVDSHDELAREYTVMSIPTILLFKDGEIIKKQIGLVPKEVIKSWLN